ncbi:FkbM family methyltransferase [Halobacterium sp. NMX12-1]|uniref:FkbM family methyltransferase n=1 Tax=Halobacterium sp. NMX12-1 TaxID=3166650 RepID=A0AAU8CF28_9EURY
MTSLVDRGISVFREDGALILLKKTLQKVYREIYCKSMAARGHYSLKLTNRTVEFSAETPTLVRRNRQRFKSESKELRDFLGAIKEDDVVYDVGANTGLYSLFAAKKCPQGTVVAFEPYPPNIRVLQQDITRNGLDNVTVIKSALSDSVGEIKFSQPNDDDIGYGSSSINTGGTREEITVPTTTGDTLVADDKIPPANVVKIDVEGAEPLVLDGLEQVLSAPSCRVVYCEVHLPGVSKRPSIQDFGSSLEELEFRLKEWGFSVQRLQTKGDSEITLKAKK